MRSLFGHFIKDGGIVITLLWIFLLEESHSILCNIICCTPKEEEVCCPERLEDWLCEEQKKPTVGDG